MAEKLPSVEHLTHMRGVRVLLRATLNVPLENGAVRNMHRLNAVSETIQLLQKAGAQVILIGYIGRDPSNTLRPIHEALGEIVEDLRWAGGLTGEAVRAQIDALEDGAVLMLENLRSDPREEANDEVFARELASYANYYVNDAFPDSHRSYASLVGVPKLLPSAAGVQFLREYEHLSMATKPTAPSLFILGGAKSETKLPLVGSYVERYSDVFVGGVLANDFFKEQGYEIGASMTSGLGLAETGLTEPGKVLLPVDVTVYGSRGKQVKLPSEVLPTDTILDAGPKTVDMLKEKIAEAKTILWNGPLGDYERGFSEYTEALAREVAAAPGFTIIGGGDTVAAIEKISLHEAFDFVSTAGGAMLQFLKDGTLPAIEALVHAKH